VAYNRNNNFSRGQEAPTAFMVAHEDKNGKTYYKGTLDLGGGKAVKLVMFEIDAPKASFAISAHKKSYNQRPKRSSW
jgi:hypothetical protein